MSKLATEFISAEVHTHSNRYLNWITLQIPRKDLQGFNELHVHLWWHSRCSPASKVSMWSCQTGLQIFKNTTLPDSQTTQNSTQCVGKWIEPLWSCAHTHVQTTTSGSWISFLVTMHSFTSNQGFLANSVHWDGFWILSHFISRASSPVTQLLCDQESRSYRTPQHYKQANLQNIFIANVPQQAPCTGR